MHLHTCIYVERDGRERERERGGGGGGGGGRLNDRGTALVSMQAHNKIPTYKSSKVS